MIVSMDFGRFTVHRTPEDGKIYKETAFWHALKKHLNEVYGTDLVKRLMWKDGHLVDDHDYYLRDRKWGFAIIDNHSAIRAVTTPFNEDGAVTLGIACWEQPVAAAFMFKLDKTPRH